MHAPPTLLDVLFARQPGAPVGVREQWSSAGARRIAARSFGGAYLPVWSLSSRMSARAHADVWTARAELLARIEDVGAHATAAMRVLSTLAEARPHRITDALVTAALNVGVPAEARGSA
ncbi:hypothetical protein [Geodermatophilus obscurus]|nr:hypothetical protein [Geodermatophilus obscurus]